MKPIVEHIERLTGLGAVDATRVASVVVAVLYEQLPPRDRARFVRGLPGELERAVSPDAPEQADSLDAVYERVGRRLGVEVAIALELTQIVCSTLGGALDPELRSALEASLPQHLLPLFAPSKTAGHSGSPPHPPDGARRYTTLAEGHPGATHPVSVSRPERAQPESLARTNEPHAQDKLSSSHGAAPERDTLADGQPGSKRPLHRGNE